jgi:hypothetical protein
VAAALLTLAELETRLGYTLPGALSDKAEAELIDASAIVRQHARGLLDAVEPPDVPPGIVAVMVSMMRRVTVNPNAFSGQAIDGHQWQAGQPTGIFANRHEIRAIRRELDLLGIGSIVMEGDLPMPIRQGLASFDDELADSFPNP